MGKGRWRDEEEDDEEEGTAERSWIRDTGGRGEREKREGYGGRPLRPRGLH